MKPQTALHTLPLEDLAGVSGGQYGALTGSVVGGVASGNPMGVVVGATVGGVVDRNPGTLIGGAVGALAGSVLPFGGTVAGATAGAAIGGVGWDAYKLSKEPMR